MKMNLIQTEEFEKRISPNGYISIKIDGYWILEHKWVVQQLIGRELTKEEVVHHIDCNKKNNRISNLMLFKNQREHQKFHLKIIQFGLTNPIIRQINNRWKEFEI